MLTIINALLPNNTLSYLAFRIACLDTLERIVLARQFNPEAAEGFGYLTEVPFLRAVPPQVQLDLLSETWQKHLHRERFEGDLVDESVLFAVCETAARVAEQESPQFKTWGTSGPRRISLTSKGALPTKLRQVHLALPNEGDFLLISQFEDLPPLESLSLKAQFGLEPSKCEAMFEVLGRWHVSPGFAGRLTGLLTDREIAQAVAVVKSTVSVGLPSHPQA
ncbi:MAG: hypothetical protein DWI21_14230 [Planctomycetota bacterium]|nr:MAG: hypothetical protein DWI21_14230 [Planctomycetota bacterium]